jgi:hypothetical protein
MMPTKMCAQPGRKNAQRHAVKLGEFLRMPE